MPYQRAHRALRTQLRIWMARASLPALLARADERFAASWFAAINGAFAIGIVVTAAWIGDAPLMFPALGPTVFILYSAPLSPAATPRSVIMGHYIAIIAGTAAWHATSHASGNVVTLEASGCPAICSATIAMGITALLLIRLRSSHPPACASAMIVALGGVGHWFDLLCMAIAVLLVTGQAIVVNRLAGLPYSLWSQPALAEN